MATYIPNLTDSIPDLPAYRPDIGFFQQQMQISSSRYEQGYNQVRGAYDSILNAPLSNNENISARNEYLKQAQDKLKNLSSVDLSLPQNVDAANNVFAPFWQDDKMLIDASITKSTQNEMARGEMLRDSKDPDERSQYSETAMQYLSNGLDKLKSATRSDPTSWNNLEKRRYVPFVDSNAYWNKQLKDQGFKVEWDEQRGMQMIHHINGEPTQQSFAAFALANQSPQMADMNRVKAIVEKEYGIKQAKSLHPGITDQQALGMVADGVISDYRANYNKILGSLSSSKSSNDQNIAEYEKIASKNGGLTQAQKDQYNQLKDTSLQLQNQIDSKNREFADIKTDSGKDAISLRAQITNNPDYYFNNLEQTRSVNNWATAASRNETRNIVLNPIWAEKAKEDYENAGLKIQEGHLNIDQQQLGINQFDSNTKRLEAQIEAAKAGFSLDASGSLTGVSGSNTDISNKGHVVGIGDTDVTKIGNANEVFNQRQSERLNNANEGILSLPGMGRAIVGLDGGKGKVSEEDIVNYFSVAKRQLSASPDDRALITLTPEERASKSRVDAALVHSTGVNIKDPESLREAVITYGKQYIAGKAKTGGVGLTPEDQQSLYVYQNAVTQRTQALAYQATKDRLMKKALVESNDSDVKPLIITRSNGSKDLIGSDDIKGAFRQSYQLVDSDGNKVTMSPSRLAQHYMQGKLTQGTSGGIGNVIKIDGKDYYRGGNPDVPANMFHSGGYKNSLIDDINHLANRIGSSEKVAGIINRVQNQVVPNIGEFQNQTGAMGVRTNYDIDDPKSKDGSSAGTRLVQEIANPQNQAGQIYVDGAATTDANVIKAVGSLTTMGNSDLKKYVSGVTHISVGPTGTPAVEVKFSPENPTNKTEIGGVKLSELADKTLVIPLSPNASGPTISALPRNTGHYVYQSMIEGKTLRSDPMLNAAGFSYTIQPDNTKNPRQVYVTIDQKVINSKTGQYENQPSKKAVFDLYGPNAKTPDEIESSVNGLFSVHIQQNQTNQELYKNTAKEAGQLFSISDINKDRK